MSHYQSKTSPELLSILKRWQEAGDPEDAIWLAEQMPHLLEDVARVKTGFSTLRKKVRQLESEMETYRRTRLLAEIEEDAPRH